VRDEILPRRERTGRVAHLSANRYSAEQRQHATAAIWRELAKGFRRYYVIARSETGRGAVYRDGNVIVILLPSRIARQAEFVIGQFFVSRLLSRLRLDAILCQSPLLGGYAALTQGRRTPFLVEFHGEHYFPSLDRRAIARLVRWLARPVVARATRARALSPSMQWLIEQDYRLQPDRIGQIPIRVDLAVFSEAKQSYVRSGPLKVVHVGALNGNKGQLRLITALTGSDLDIELWLVGAGPDRAALEAAAASVRPRLAVILKGQLVHAEVARLLLAADVYAHFSRSEGTPRAIAEAMACGLPVIATDVGLVRDIVSDGVDGLLLTTEGEICATLEKLATDVALRERLGRAAAARARREFDAQQVFARYRRLIAETAELVQP
jgi:glycosyltransferase involved in cell wall biosynthesis